MAEIKIEKKAPVWPWIIAALLIVGALLYFFVLKDESNDDGLAGAAGTTEETRAADPTTATAPTTRDNDAVGVYVQYVNERGNMGLDHEYTSTALERLENAVQAKADEVGYDIQVDLDRIDDHAEHITDDPMETSHASHIRSAADALSTAMRNMQREHFPNLDQQVQQVEQAASGIDPNTLTLDQKDAVKGFFDKSASLLQNMQ